jgi:hypothetical protein
MFLHPNYSTARLIDRESALFRASSTQRNPVSPPVLRMRLSSASPELVLLLEIAVESRGEPEAAS